MRANIDGYEVPSPVAVTGAAGYVASWVVKELLDAGAVVHATVRSRGERDKIAHLLRLEHEYPDRVRLFEADLMVPESFVPAFAGCRALAHVASPFRTRGILDPQRELIAPALEGTRNVLCCAAAAETVTRVVLTSSLAAVYGDAADLPAQEGAAFDEGHWNTTSSPRHQPYAYSKTIAEREAWKLASAQSRFRLVSILPGFVVGPALSARLDATSTETVLQLLDGRMRSGVPDLRFAMVDVRDVARAHLAALYRPDAEGRYIVAAEELSLLDLAAMLREQYGDRYPIPRGRPPTMMLYLLAPWLGMTWKFLRRNLAKPVSFRNDRSKQLGIEYGSLRRALREQAAQLEAQAKGSSAARKLATRAPEG